MAMHPIAHRRPLPDGTPLLNDPQRLQALAHLEGVVLLRGLIPQADLGPVQKVLTDAACKVGWLKRGKGLAGVVENGSDPRWQKWYGTIQSSRAFHALPHVPAIQAAMHAVLGGEVLTHPRNIARCVGPQTKAFTTPPHQDVWYIGGTPDIWTMWAPLTDCPDELGGLALLPRTHLLGHLASRTAAGAGGRGIACALGDTWAWEPLKAGDVLVFHGQTVHQGCDNRSDRLRLSVDLRFQRADQPLRADSLEPHYHLHTWDEIYRSWPPDDQLRYYWKRQKLQVINA